jgi:hypothetical protein
MEPSRGPFRCLPEPTSTTSKPPMKKASSPSRCRCPTVSRPRSASRSKPQTDPAADEPHGSEPWSIWTDRCARHVINDAVTRAPEAAGCRRSRAGLPDWLHAARRSVVVSLNLRERQHALGWLAISGSNDLIHIAVTAPTAAETAELYERKRRDRAALAQAEPSADG